MRKIIIVLMILLLMSGCSSSLASNNSNNNIPSTTDENLDPNETDIIIEPVPSTNNDSSNIDVPSSDDVVIDNSTENSEPQNSEPQAPPISDSVDTSTFDVSKLNYEEFDNLYGEITYNGVPEARESLTLKNANGVWRYNLKLRYDDSLQGYMYDELGYAQMYVNGSDNPPIRITLHPRKASDGYEVWDETDENIGYVPFEGNIDDDNIIRLHGNNAIIVPEYYYALNGKEYLIGKMWMSEESSASFLMIREKE